MRVVDLTEVPPNGCLRRNDVGLISAVRNHTMRALLWTQVFAAIAPPDIHQFNGVQGTSSAPWRCRSVSRFTMETVFHRNQSTAFRWTVDHGHIRTDMRKQTHVDVLKKA